MATAGGATGSGAVGAAGAASVVRLVFCFSSRTRGRRDCSSRSCDRRGCCRGCRSCSCSWRSSLGLLLLLDDRLGLLQIGCCCSGSGASGKQPRAAASQSASPAAAAALARPAANIDFPGYGRFTYIDRELISYDNDHPFGTDRLRKEIPYPLPYSRHWLPQLRLRRKTTDTFLVHPVRGRIAVLQSIGLLPRKLQYPCSYSIP